MTTYFKTCSRDDGETKVTVEYRVTSPGCSAHYGSMSYEGHPAEAPEIEFVTAFTDTEDNVKLTDVESQRFYEEIVCNHEEDDYDPYDDRI